MDEEMEQLKANLLKLASLAEDSVRKAIWALKNQDMALAEEVVVADDAIDDLAHKIDEDSLQIIASYQPVAMDLRVVAAVIHLAVDLERIADIAGNIAKTALKTGHRKPLKPLIDIPRMGEVLCEMIDTAMKSFINQDIDLAKKVCAMDDLMDDLNQQIFNELLLIMIEDPRTIEQATMLLHLAGRLERAGDHATNLAEWIIFMITGKTVKASSFRRPKEN